MPTEKEPASSPLVRPTNFGALALASAAGIALPMLAFLILSLVRVQSSPHIPDNISRYVFNFGGLISLLTLALIVPGLSRRGSSRVLALAALLLLAAPWVLMFVL